MSRYHIGKVAELVGCGVDTLRYYEKLDLIPKPPRSDGGQRIYTQELVDLLRFIKRARDLDFSLDEIQKILSITQCGTTSSAGIVEITSNHLTHIQERIAALRSIEHKLTDLLDACQSDDLDNCPIIRELSLPVGRSAG